MMSGREEVEVVIGYESSESDTPNFGPNPDEGHSERCSDNGSSVHPINTSCQMKNRFLANSKKNHSMEVPDDGVPLAPHIGERIHFLLQGVTKQMKDIGEDAPESFVNKERNSKSKYHESNVERNKEEKLYAFGADSNDLKEENSIFSFDRSSPRAIDPTSPPHPTSPPNPPLRLFSRSPSSERKSSRDSGNSNIFKMSARGSGER